jgi:hypothetical protein
MAGLAICTLTHITEIEADHDIIRDLIGGPNLSMPNRSKARRRLGDNCA